MKSNIFKYIFGIVVIALVSFSAYTLYQEEEKKIGNNQIEQPQQEETIITELRVPIVDFDTMNPILSKNKNIQDIARLIYEPLLTITQDYQIELCLAKEWSKTSPTTYLLKLREDVKWQDGKPFEAKDVQYTIDRLKEESIGSIYDWNVQNVIQVEVVDSNTIKIELNKEIPFFEYNLTFPIMAQHYYENENFITSSKNTIPVGTGRYKVTANEANIVTLKQNQNWWNREHSDAKIKTIVLNKYRSMGEVYNAFKIGNIDLLTTQTTNIEQYIGTIGYQAKENKGRELDFIAFNTTKEIMKNLEVRQAINAAINKDNIVASVYQGKYYVANFPLEYGSYIAPEGIQAYEFSVDKAKQYLVNAGWEYNKSKTWQKTIEKKTQRLKLDFIVKQDNEKRVQVAELIKTGLEEVGIKVNLIKATNSQYQNYLKNKNYDLILTGVYTSYSPDLSTYYGENNIAGIAEEELQNIMKEIPSISDEKLLRQKYQKIAEIQGQQLPYIFLYFNRNTSIYNQNLYGEIKPNNYNIFYGIESWYRK